MKTQLLFISLLTTAFMTTAQLRAEDQEHAHEHSAMCACMKEMSKDKGPAQKKMMMMGPGKMGEMKAKMKAEQAELQKLVEEMNTSTGEKKVEAISALLNKMVQTHKAMCEKMDKMAASPPPSGAKEGAAPNEQIEKAEPADPHAGHQH